MNDRRHTAFHEAGHAVIGRAMAQLCDGVTIEPDEEAGEAGFAICFDHWMTMSVWDQLGRWRDRSSIVLGRIITYMAGRAAEEELLGYCEGGDGDDQFQIEMMLETIGRDDDPGFRARLVAMTRMLVRRHTRTIEAVAAALLDRGKLDRSAIASLIPFTSLGHDMEGRSVLLLPAGC